MLAVSDGVFGGSMDILTEPKERDILLFLSRLTNGLIVNLFGQKRLLNTLYVNINE